MDKFNIYNVAILRELEDQWRFIIVGHSINNLRYAADTLLIIKESTITPTEVRQGNRDERNSYEL